MTDVPGQDEARPVVVGVDGSTGSESAVEFAAWEAGWRRVPLVLVHGFVAPRPFGAFHRSEGPEAVSLHDHANSALTKLRDKVQREHPELSVRAKIAEGSGAHVLVESAATAAVVITGSRGTGGFAGLMLGSVSTQVAAHANAPVIVVRPTKMTESTRSRPSGPVVVGVDGSADSSAAIEFGFEEARARKAPLKAVFTWVGAYGAVCVIIDGQPRSHDEANRMVKDIVDHVANRFPDVELTWDAKESFNADEPLIEASHEAGLVVVGSRGLGGFASLLLGSVSRNLLESAQSPVAVVRRQPSK